MPIFTQDLIIINSFIIIKMNKDLLTNKDAWPSYFPDYNTSEGWEAEKLQAEIKIREHLNEQWTEQMFAAMGSVKFFEIFDRVNKNLSGIYESNERLYAICRTAVGIKDVNEVVFHEQV